MLKRHDRLRWCNFACIFCLRMVHFKFQSRPSVSGPSLPPRLFLLLRDHWRKRSTHRNTSFHGDHVATNTFTSSATKLTIAVIVQNISRPTCCCTLRVFREYLQYSPSIQYTASIPRIYLRVFLFRYAASLYDSPPLFSPPFFMLRTRVRKGSCRSGLLLTRPITAEKLDLKAPATHVQTRSKRRRPIEYAGYFLKYTLLT